jgi:dipeptidyl aminopeptidase/acylaminoacyl peptidase
MPENFSVHARLDSWKEIADYLKRDVRTAIRWGKDRGMPVHRVPGAKRQVVFAFKDEIDDWLLSPKFQDIALRLSTDLGDQISNQPHPPNVEPGEDVNSRPAGGLASIHSPGPASEAGHKSVIIRAERTNPRKMLVIGACLVVVAIISLSLLRSRAPAAVRPFSLKALTDDGQQKAGVLTDGKNLYFNEVIGARTILVSAPVSGGPIRQIDTNFSNVMLEDLSKDGSTLLVKSVEGLAHEGRLWTIPAAGGTPRRVGDASCTTARWSPDNQRIACAIGTMITLTDTDGSNPGIVGSFSLPVGEVMWTPEGTRLLFTLNDTKAHTNSQWEIAVDRSGGTAQAERLPLSPRCCGGWTWTEDGTAFFSYSAYSPGQDRLFMIPKGRTLTDANVVELPVRIGTVKGLAPDRNRNLLYLVIENGFRGDLLQFDAKHLAPTTFLPGLSAGYVAFSGDGQWITYARTQDASLWRSRADGTEPLRLTEPPMHVEVSSWSPDGRRIAFMGMAPGKPSRIFLVGRDGGPVEELTVGNDNQGGPSWSPDGKTIVYGNVFGEESKDGWIRRVDLATRKVETVPGSHNFRTARWSPDGKYIAALNWQTREVMLFNVRRAQWTKLAESITGDNINWSSDSQSILVDSPRDEKPVLERIQVRSGLRVTVADLASLQKVPGAFSWTGLTPNNSPLLLHMHSISEVYALEWTEH